jgi:phosphoglycolate phosphatase
MGDSYTVARTVLLFDLDGTLTDPRPGLVGSIRYALERLGAACPSDEALASYIGPPLRGTFAALLATTEPGRIEDAMRLYRERYGVAGLFENAVYAGIPETLAELAATTARRYIATAKPAVFARRIADHFGLARHFDGIYGPELDGRFDAKADLIAHLLAAEGVAAANAVMIGDRANDIAAARANRVRSVGVLWGYGSAAELTDAGADALCAAPGDLSACLDTLATVR